MGNLIKDIVLIVVSRSSQHLFLNWFCKFIYDFLVIIGLIYKVLFFKTKVKYLSKTIAIFLVPIH